MIVGPHTISDGPTARTYTAIKDGLANTIMVVEATEAHINWLEPRDLDVKKMQFQIRRRQQPRQQQERDLQPAFQRRQRALLRRIGAIPFQRHRSQAA